VNRLAAISILLCFLPYGAYALEEDIQKYSERLKGSKDVEGRMEALSALEKVWKQKGKAAEVLRQKDEAHALFREAVASPDGEKLLRLIEKQKGSETRHALKQILDEGGGEAIEKLKALAEENLHTQAGWESAVLLSRYEMDRGKYKEARKAMELAEKSALSQRSEDANLLVLAWLAQALDRNSIGGTKYIEKLEKRKNEAVDLGGMRCLVSGLLDHMKSWDGLGRMELETIMDLPSHELKAKRFAVGQKWEVPNINSGDKPRIVLDERVVDLTTGQAVDVGSGKLLSVTDDGTFIQFTSDASKINWKKEGEKIGSRDVPENGILSTAYALPDGRVLLYSGMKENITGEIKADAIHVLSPTAPNWKVGRDPKFGMPEEFNFGDVKADFTVPHGKDGLGFSLPKITPGCIPGGSCFSSPPRLGYIFASPEGISKAVWVNSTYEGEKPQPLPDGRAWISSNFGDVVLAESPSVTPRTKIKKVHLLKNGQTLGVADQAMYWHKNGKEVAKALVPDSNRVIRKVLLLPNDEVLAREEEVWTGNPVKVPPKLFLYKKGKRKKEIAIDGELKDFFLDADNVLHVLSYPKEDLKGHTLQIRRYKGLKPKGEMFSYKLEEPFEELKPLGGDSYMIRSATRRSSLDEKLSDPVTVHFERVRLSKKFDASKILSFPCTPAPAETPTPHKTSPATH
jgi:hypothetical protein